MNTNTKKNMKRLGTTLGYGAALAAIVTTNIAVLTVARADALVPNTTTPTTSIPNTTSTTMPGPYSKYIGRGEVTLARKDNTVRLAVESQWCRSWGEGEYRIRDFKLNYVTAPEDRNKPVAEGSFGFPSHTVVQARAVYCGRSAEGLTEYPVSAAGLRIDITVPRYFKGNLAGMRVIQNVVRNWSDNATFFEGPIPAQMKALAPGNYTVTAVSTQFPADTVNLTYSVANPPR